MRNSKVSYPLPCAFNWHLLWERIAVALSTHRVNNAFRALHPSPSTKRSPLAIMSQPKTFSKSKSTKTSSKSDSSKVHKLALKGSSKVVNEFVRAPRTCHMPDQALTTFSLSTRSTPSCMCQATVLRTADGQLTAARFQRGVYPAEDFTA